MPGGPQEARLDRAVSGAARSAIQAAEEEWRNGARALDNVAMALEMAGPQVIANFGGTHTGPAAQQAFGKVAEKVRARKEQMEQAADALAKADVAVGEAKQVQASMGALPSEPARPDIAPGTNDADAVRQQRTYSTQLGGYHAAMADREAKAEAAANEMDRVYRDSTATMKQVHGEPDARSGGGSGSGGGGGAVTTGGSSSGGTAATSTPATTSTSQGGQPTSAPAGHRHPARRRPARRHAPGDHGAGHSPGRDRPSADVLHARDRRCDRLGTRRERDRCRRRRRPRGRSRRRVARRRCRDRGRGPRWRHRRPRLHRLCRPVDRQQRPDRHGGRARARRCDCRRRVDRGCVPHRGRERGAQDGSRRRDRTRGRCHRRHRSRGRTWRLRIRRSRGRPRRRRLREGREPGSGRAARGWRPVEVDTSVTRTATTGTTSSSRRRSGSTTRTPLPE